MSARSAPFAARALVLMALATFAVAGPADDGTALYHQGVAAFQAGDHGTARARFQGAIELLPPTHELFPKTRYNLARSIEELGDPCAAHEAFVAYLATAEDMASETRRVGKARTAAEATGAGCEATKPPPPPPPVEEPEAPPPVEQPEAPPAAVDPPEPVGPPASAQAVWGWVCVGTGAAALVGGVVMNLAARDSVAQSDDAYDDFLASGRQDGEAADDVTAFTDLATTQATVSYALIGAGVALAGLGIGLVVADDGPELAPSVGEQGAGVTIRGRW